MSAEMMSLTLRFCQLVVFAFCKMNCEFVMRHFLCVGCDVLAQVNGQSGLWS